MQTRENKQGFEKILLNIHYLFNIDKLLLLLYVVFLNHVLEDHPLQTQISFQNFHKIIKLRKLGQFSALGIQNSASNISIVHANH